MIGLPCSPAKAGAQERREALLAHRPWTPAFAGERRSA
jgi:hypothetical protein